MSEFLGSMGIEVGKWNDCCEDETDCLQQGIQMQRTKGTDGNFELKITPFEDVMNFEKDKIWEFIKQI